MIKRNSYLNNIRPFIGKPVIKAVTGVRRCGKSTLMVQIIKELEASGIVSNQIIYINKELYEFDTIRNYADLHQYVTKNTNTSKQHYLFVDEIQEIEDWEKAIGSLLAQNKYDIYITGSNARLLSSELATLLSGRYVEFKMHTFSFSEFIELSNQSNKPYNESDSFDIFLKYGGFPGIHLFEWNDLVLRQYLQSVYSTILLKDVVVRYNIRDAGILEKIIDFMIDNCGNITSAKSISDFVKSQHRKVSVDTVQSYISHTCSALLIHQIRRYDLKGKRILETLEKYYMSDLGFRFATLGYSPDAISGLLENAILLELLIRGYHVNTGKIYDKEIDFIAQKGSDKIYIQVCTLLTDGKVIDREYGSLAAVKDHYPKIVLSLDSGFETSRNGIQWINIKDFLLQKTVFGTS